jgi:hypothetical protein
MSRMTDVARELHVSFEQVRELANALAADHGPSKVIAAMGDQLPATPSGPMFYDSHLTDWAVREIAERLQPGPIPGIDTG